nr:MAG TPA: hypothetical protein [Caudoviricetes sp.]DAU54689.1 MAG TPA: hypothetical protein [Caudoviricetes sp.]
MKVHCAIKSFWFPLITTFFLSNLIISIFLS